jgi:c(7)-type cytochrome triheme protein
MVTSNKKWAIAIALGVMFAWGAALAAPPIIPVGDRRFDHGTHDASSKAGGKLAACADCHKMDAKGVRVIPGGEHPRCVKCHSFPKTCPEVKAFAGTPKNPARLCDSCHKPTGTCALPPLPAKPSGPTYASRFAHGEHVGFKVAIEQECMKCHAEQAPAGTPTTVAHTLCFRCHAGQGGVAKLQSNNCTGCHQPPKAKAGPSNDPFRLGKFDHRKHHTDSRMGANNTAICSSCHDQKKIAAATDVPRPSMTTCMQSCHDGQKAFSAIGTTCTKCHKSTVGGAGLTFAVKDPVFTHAKHITRNVKIDGVCTNCHGIATDGTSAAMPPLHTEDPNASRNHMPCAASGCHQTEFLSRSVKICGVCHDKANPWDKVVARNRTDKRGTEFFESMNHQSHLQKKGTSNAACADCHGDKLGGGNAPKGHAPCAECHGKGPPAHAMTDCDKCHSKTPPTRAGSTEWSVASVFVHKSHTRDPRPNARTPTTNCIECHADVGKSRTLADMGKPKMQTCDGCHNGKTAFKTTGFDCARCHTKGKQPSTPTSQSGFTSQGNEQAMLDPSRGDLR